jgi:hypothetical protein
MGVGFAETRILASGRRQDSAAAENGGSVHGLQVGCAGHQHGKWEAGDPGRSGRAIARRTWLSYLKDGHHG